MKTDCPCFAASFTFSLSAFFLAFLQSRNFLTPSLSRVSRQLLILIFSALRRSLFRILRRTGSFMSLASFSSFALVFWARVTQFSGRSFSQLTNSSIPSSKSSASGSIQGSIRVQTRSTSNNILLFTAPNKSATAGSYSTSTESSRIFLPWGFSNGRPKSYNYLPMFSEEYSFQENSLDLLLRFAEPDGCSFDLFKEELNTDTSIPQQMQNECLSGDAFEPLQPQPAPELDLLGRMASARMEQEQKMKNYFERECLSSLPVKPIRKNSETTQAPSSPTKVKSKRRNNF